MDYCGTSYSKACGYLVPTWTVEPNIQSIHKGRLLGYVWKITLFKLLCSYLNCIRSYSLKINTNLYTGNCLRPAVLKLVKTVSDCWVCPISFLKIFTKTLESVKHDKNIPGTTYDIL